MIMKLVKAGTSIFIVDNYIYIYKYFFTFFSGLRIVGVDFAGEGILNIDTFTVGTNDNVFVVLNATCCVRKALLSMIDVAGNANRAEFNKGPLKGTSKTRYSERGCQTLFVH